jgi:hypothetical protein
MLCSVTRTVSETSSWKEEFVCARLIRARPVSGITALGGTIMSKAILGVDIAKRKFDVALETEIREAI